MLLLLHEVQEQKSFKNNVTLKKKKKEWKRSNKIYGHAEMKSELE